MAQNLNSAQMNILQKQLWETQSSRSNSTPTQPMEFMKKDIRFLTYTKCSKVSPHRKNPLEQEFSTDKNEYYI